MSVRSSWLPAFVAADRFFTPCGKCASQHSARDATINFWDTEAQQELCSVCLHDFPRESVIQVGRGTGAEGRGKPPRVAHWACDCFVVSMGARRRLQPRVCSPISCPCPPSQSQVRRSSYHDVVKVADITRMADIGGIQSYVINGSKVLFLRRRPQPRPPKGAVGASQCGVCSRHLQDVAAYCSLQCKLDCEAGAKPAAPRAADESRSTGPETPHALLTGLKPLLDSGSDSDTG